MSIQQFGKKFPILLRTPSPRGQVELLETIGKGNYGYVYKGRLIASNEITAVKVVQLKEDELKETLLEMEIIKACNHLNVTSYMGCFLKGLDLWICMEFCGGGALDSLYRAIKKTFSEDQIAAIIHDCLGLDYLHTQVALIHRDIKAGNVFLTEDGEIKLGDFGVSAKLSNPNGRARTFIGTPYWMAPEVIRCDPDSASSRDASYDYKADIWSIGITAIEIADKNPPLSDIHPMRALYLIPDSDLNLAKPKAWSKPFVDFIANCLVKDPVKRPSAAKLLEHPFMQKARGLNRKGIIADLIVKAKIARDRKKAGYDVDEDDEEDEKKEEVPAKVVHETMRQAKMAQQQQQTQQQAQVQVQQPAAATAAPAPAPVAAPLPPQQQPPSQAAHVYQPQQPSAQHFAPVREHFAVTLNIVP
ncbi:kinase-like domain-containing protein [Zopfochytrium polystomum]|nr:kinase-like domain-containing protein [Zopfochytrium polystomum]